MSSSIKSDQSPCVLVKPQAIRPLLPTTIPGPPGTVTPTAFLRLKPLSSGHSRQTRYQILGTRKCKCMSFATQARSSSVLDPARAQLLLPATKSSSSRHGVGSGVDTGSLRRSKTSALGTGGGVIEPPNIGASHSTEPLGERNSARGPGRTSRRTPRADSLAILSPCKSRNNARLTSTLSSAHQGFGVSPRSRYSNVRAFSDPSPASTPAT